jgi:hypothetical protein
MYILIIKCCSKFYAIVISWCHELILLRKYCLLTSESRAIDVVDRSDLNDVRSQCNERHEMAIKTLFSWRNHKSSSSSKMLFFRRQFERLQRFTNTRSRRRTAQRLANVSSSSSSSSNNNNKRVSLMSASLNLTAASTRTALDGRMHATHSDTFDTRILRRRYYNVQTLIYQLFSMFSYPHTTINYPKPFVRMPNIIIELYVTQCAVLIRSNIQTSV